ncbi:MAG: NAD kinase [Paludibacteraceae bacterium]|nr:NAD kinase [Paludibacteraceae bacterium]
MKAVIFGNTCRSEVAACTHKLLAALARHDVEMLMERDFLVFLRSMGVPIDLFISEKNLIDYRDYEADLAFVVGGDGTFIHSAAKVGRRDLPMIGINAGRLGFLTDLADSHIDEVVDSLMSGKYTCMERTLLRLHTDEKVYTDFNYALNEVTVSKMDSASLITIHTWVNGKFLNSYQADGLIVSTATGSTAYSMSVGGPILMPNVPAFIIIPVAPHSLTMRPLIIPDTSTVELKVESRSNHFLIALDGRSNVFDEHISMRINKSAFTIKTIKLEDHNFFDTMREKLMWGSDKRKYLKKGYDDDDKEEGCADATAK